MSKLALTDAERDLALKPDLRPTSKAPGHWRGVARFSQKLHFRALVESSTSRCGCKHLGDREWLECTRHTSAEVCEQRGLEYDAAASRVFGPGASTFLRAEFFPDYGGGA